MLSDREIDLLLPDFPSIKLSYENITHNKVFNAEITIAIPEGTKCFAWFTHYKNNNVCLIMELNAKKNIISVKRVPCCFRNDISYGTILYGTIFIYAQTSFFTMEDIFYYKGKNVSRQTWIDKFVLFTKIMKHDIKQVAYNNYFVIFGLPVIAKSNEELDSSLKSINYKLDSIKYYTSNSHYLLPFEEYTHTSEDRIFDIKKIEKKIDKKIEKKIDKKFEKKSYSKIFICKPDIQNDIYHLYTLDNEYIGLSAIPDYKTSVMMNNLFRIIKENNDLDALEESDDEEEFENSNVDKFVNLDKS